MRKLTKGISGLIILFFLWGVYLSIRTNQYERQLEEVSQKFIIACQSSAGCLVNIERLGWKKEQNYKCDCIKEIPVQPEMISYSYSKNGMIYNATPEKFTITWHIMTDTNLVATGGKNIPFAITTVYE